MYCKKLHFYAICPVCPRPCVLCCWVNLSMVPCQCFKYLVFVTSILLYCYQIAYTWYPEALKCGWQIVAFQLLTQARHKFIKVAGIITIINLHIAKRVKLDMVGLNMCLHPSSQEVMDHEGCHFHPCHGQKAPIIGCWCCYKCFCVFVICTNSVFHSIQVKSRVSFGVQGAKGHECPSFHHCHHCNGHLKQVNFLGLIVTKQKIASNTTTHSPQHANTPYPTSTGQ
jgi:Zn-finger protein